MSISGMSLNLPDDIEADVGTIRDKCGTLTRLCSTMMGRSHDMDGSFQDAAGHFTDEVMWDIQGASGRELTKWEDTGAALTNGAAVLQLWADDIETYRETRAELLERWETEKSDAQGRVDHPWYLGAFGVTGYAVDALTDGRADREAEEIAKLETIRGELLSEHSTAWDLLMDRAEQTESDLKDGPSPETYERLLNAGHLSWRHLSVFMPDEGPPVNEGMGEDAADEVEEYLEDPENYEGDIGEVLAILAVVTSSGVQNQRNGGQPPGDHMDFLEAFYEGFEGTLLNVGGPPGVLGVVDLLENGEDYDSAVTDDLLSSMGEGIMVLSDENLFGGWDRLPESIQMAAAGPQLIPDDMTNQGGIFYGPDAWGRDLAALNRLLGSAPSDVQAGEDLSSSLTLSLGNAMDAQDGPGPWIEQSDAADLIGIAARHHDAMHGIFTGEYEHPFMFEDGEFREHALFNSEHNEDHAKDDYNPNDNFIDSALKGIYGFDWTDEEELSVREMTDWISDDAWHEDEFVRERSAEAAAGFIDRITSKDMYDTLSGVGELGVTDDDFDPDAVEESFTAVNPAISDSLTGIYESYIASFAGQAGMDGGSIDLQWTRDAEDPVWDDDEGIFDIGPGERMVFMEYLLGDSDSAERVVMASEVYSEAQVQRHLDGGDYEQAASSAARLEGLLDASFQNEAVSRGLSVEDAQAKKEEVYTNLSKVGTTALGYIPKVGPALSLGGSLISEEAIEGIFEDYVVTTPRDDDYSDDSSVRNNSRAAALERALESSGGELPEFEGTTETSSSEVVDSLVESGVLVDDGSGGYSVERNSNEWNVGKGDEDLAQDLNTVLGGAEVDWVEGHPETGEGAHVNGENLLEFSDQYADKHRLVYNDTHNQLNYDKGNIEDLYSRHQ